MRALRYKAVVDGEVIWDSNSVKRCKEKADHVLEYRNGYHAEIRTGRKLYAARFYDTKWTRYN